jgi:deoxyribodipyrimidine photo-lyase
MSSPPAFPTSYPQIIQQLGAIDPLQYASTRNYVSGAVTRLSPYISRGVISTRQVLEQVLARGYELKKIEVLVKELCWRDYFQRVAQEKDIDQDIKQPQAPVLNHAMPLSIVNGTTGITGIDQSIQALYDSGYMHNHCRMYTASVVCNIAGSHWRHPAQWMYYHLLDGDWASNACSWQWVAGANSSKKYYASQENINKYTHTDQHHTFLDKPYDILQQLEVPDVLMPTGTFQPEPLQFTSAALQINDRLPTFLYNYYNLDPLWHEGEAGNRILLIEPDIFNQYPISKKCIEFMLGLSQNIPGIQVYAGSFQALSEQVRESKIYYKEHPFNRHYQGIQEERDWIVPEVKGYYPSFFAFWKKVEKRLMGQK